MTDGVMYRNDDWTIILIDIPSSIAGAQGFDDGSRLLSCEPISEPYPSTEPNSEKAKAKLQNYAKDKAFHDEIRHAALQALGHLKDVIRSDQSYCVTREIDEVEQNLEPAMKSQLAIGGEAEMRNHLETETEPIPPKKKRKLAYFLDDKHRNPAYTAVLPDGSRETFDGTVVNELSHSERISVEQISTGVSVDYRLPKFSYGVQTVVKDTATLRSAAREYSEGPSPARGRFDLILMDPPWPNLSAKRSRAYSRAPTHDQARGMLLSMNIDIHTGPGGYIAVWITNNPNIRELVLGDGGLFARWDVQLIEEWIWVKVTSKGEPVTSLDGAWRKPYELLLIGKAPPDRYRIPDVLERGTIKRRVIAAVPDLHSRKPCLKMLFEPLLFSNKQEGPKVLEIFARYLVAGWMSWGNEVLKYNDLRYWRTGRREQATDEAETDTKAESARYSRKRTRKKQQS